jgi:hypothetical protein
MPSTAANATMRSPKDAWNKSNMNI